MSHTNPLPELPSADHFVVAKRPSYTTSRQAAEKIREAMGLDASMFESWSGALVQRIQREAYDLGARSTARPSDDALWDQTLRERDNYHEWADKLAEAISRFIGFDIGEHTNVNNPWARAVDMVPAGTLIEALSQARSTAAQPVEPMVTPTEAVVGFASWLSCRPGTLSAGECHDASPLAEVVHEYVVGQGWPGVRDEAFPHNLKRMTIEHPPAASGDSTPPSAPVQGDPTGALRPEPEAAGQGRVRAWTEAPGAERVWTCKIGGPVAGIPKGSDSPMRAAVARAFEKITGFEARFIFSGWGGELTESERAVVEDRLPSHGMWRKKPVVVAATQWFKNGDHPLDYSQDHDGFEGGELRVFTGAERKANGWEGDIVRYYRHPDVPGESACEQCGKTHHVHGWIDTLEQGHRVCPGDWIITGVKGERYPCKPDIFAATYEPAEPPQAASGERGD